jgi:hypothetical protein
MTSYEIEPPPIRLGDRVQLRTAFTTGGSGLTAFMSQLEYWIEGEWCAVVRYDHNPEMSRGHDVTEEGLHRDVYRNRAKVDTVDVTGPIPASEGFDYARNDLRENAERYVRRFESWHNVDPRDTTDL